MIYHTPYSISDTFCTVYTILSKQMMSKIMKSFVSDYKNDVEDPSMLAMIEARKNVYDFLEDQTQKIHEMHQQYNIDVKNSKINDKEELVGKTKGTNRVKLNVGGKMFSVSRDTLTNKESLLKTIVNHYEKDVVGDDEVIFIDRDPENFGTLLEFLRGIPFENNTLSLSKKLEEEILFYDIEELKDVYNSNKDTNKDTKTNSKPSECDSEGVKYMKQYEECVSKVYETNCEKRRKLNLVSQDHKDKIARWVGGEIVRLDVGGEIFETTYKSLLSIPDTYFYNIFSDKSNVCFEDDGTFFIDRSPEGFNLILGSLRGQYVNICSFRDICNFKHYNINSVNSNSLYFEKSHNATISKDGVVTIKGNISSVFDKCVMTNVRFKEKDSVSIRITKMTNNNIMIGCAPANTNITATNLYSISGKWILLSNKYVYGPWGSLGNGVPGPNWSPIKAGDIITLKLDRTSNTLTVLLNNGYPNVLSNSVPVCKEGYRFGVLGYTPGSEFMIV